MALSPKIIKQLTDELIEAENNCKPIVAISKRYSDFSLEDAYKIQMEVIEQKINNGAKIVGRKIGLTSKAMQKLIGLNEPDFGTILDNKVYNDGDIIATKQMINPRIEAEIGFLLKKDLKGPCANIIDVLNATEGVMPLLEVKDTRISSAKINIKDAIADNATSGIVILGNKLTPISSKIDLSLIGMVFEENGKIVSTGTGAAVLGHPAIPVAWLANQLAKYGTNLKKGEFIMSGGITEAEEVSAGKFFRASFDRIGNVSVKFC